MQGSASMYREKQSRKSIGPLRLASRARLLLAQPQVQPDVAKVSRLKEQGSPPGTDLENSLDTSQRRSFFPPALTSTIRLQNSSTLLRLPTSLSLTSFHIGHDRELLHHPEEKKIGSSRHVLPFSRQAASRSWLRPLGLGPQHPATRPRPRVLPRVAASR